MIKTKHNFFGKIQNKNKCLQKKHKQENIILQSLNLKVGCYNLYSFLLYFIAGMILPHKITMPCIKKKMW